MASPAETLIASLEAATQWPVDPSWSIVQTHAAFREADTASLKRIAEWPSSRPYVPDPLPWLVAKAHADLLFGEEPEIEPANEADTELLDAITDASDIETQSHRAAQIASSEGEVWWHTYVDKVASDWPIIEFVSRSQVVCLWRGRTAAATAFVSVVRQTRADEVWRLLEVHETGRVLNLLFVGSSSRLGHAVDLGRMPELDGLEAEWRHGLGVPLCGRILNKPADPTTHLGRSDFAGVEGLFLALDEATTLGVENARLTAKKRLFVDGRYLDERGNLPAGADVLRRDDRDTGDGDKSGVSSIEYSFDAAALIAWTRDLTDRIVTRCGLVPQWVGASTDGRADTGTALRVRLIPATLTAQGKGHYFRKGEEAALLAAQLIDALPIDSGGFGRPWAAAADSPSVSLADPIPTDTMEDAQRLATLVTAELQSRRRSVSELHPELDEGQVDEELALIASDMGVAPQPVALMPASLPADPQGPDAQSAGQ